MRLKTLLQSLIIGFATSVLFRRKKSNNKSNPLNHYYQYNFKSRYTFHYKLQISIRDDPQTFAFLMWFINWWIHIHERIMLHNKVEIEYYTAINKGRTSRLVVTNLQFVHLVVAGSNSFSLSVRQKGAYINLPPVGALFIMTVGHTDT